MDDAADLERQLHRLEELFLQPATRSSRRRLEELLAEDFIEFGSSGVAYDRADVISAMVLESPQAWSMDSFHAKPLSDDVALVTYVATKSAGDAALRCSVWKRSGGRWTMAFHQGTPIRE